jgi:hypothetical protein
MVRSSSHHRRAVGLAKLTAPTLPAVLARPRLYRRLDHARKKPLVWITGPPGAGKTTLVASYLRAKRVRPPRLPGRGQIWYNVDERDGDLATFFHYLSLAAKQAAPRFRWPLPAPHAGISARLAHVHAQFLRVARRSADAANGARVRQLS